MSDDYINSIERAIEITEGQIALALVSDLKAIAVEVERAQKMVDTLREQERLVDHLFNRHGCNCTL